MFFVRRPKPCKELWRALVLGCNSFCLQLESFLLTAKLFYLQLSLGVFSLQVAHSYLCLELLYLQLELFAYNGKVPLRDTLTDCKQRSSTVSKKAPPVSERASPFVLSPKAMQTSRCKNEPKTHTHTHPLARLESRGQRKTQVAERSLQEVLRNGVLSQSVAR